MEETIAIIKESGGDLLSTWKMGCLSEEEISEESKRIKKRVQAILNDEIQKAKDFNANRVFAMGMTFYNEVIQEGIDPETDTEFILKSSNLDEMRTEIANLVNKLKRRKECQELCSKTINHIHALDSASFQNHTLFLQNNDGTEKSLQYFQELLQLKKNDYKEKTEYLIRFRQRKVLLDRISTLKCTLRRKRNSEKEEILQAEKDVDELEDFLVQNTTILIRGRTFQDNFDFEKEMRKGAIKLSEATTKTQFLDISSKMLQTPMAARILNKPTTTITQTPATVRAINTPLLTERYPTVSAQQRHSSTPRPYLNSARLNKVLENVYSGRKYM